MSQPGRNAAELRAIVDRCTYPGFKFEVHQKDFTTYLQIVGAGPDNVTGEPITWNGRKWLLSHYMTDTEIVQTCWAAVQRALLHEASEVFRFDDAAIFDRHLSVHRLVEMTGMSDAIDGRDNLDG